MKLLLFLYICISTLISVKGQNCPPISQHLLGSTSELSTDGLVPEALSYINISLSSNGLRPSPPAVQIFNYAVVCEVSGDRINTAREVSVVVEYDCEPNMDQNVNLFPECSSGVDQNTRQFIFSCLFTDLQSERTNGNWTIANDSLHNTDDGVSNSLEMMATLNTPLENRCGMCADTVQTSVMVSRFDPVTHCIDCHSNCNRGMMRCYGTGEDECCNFYQEELCVEDCASGLVPIENDKSQHVCGCPGLSSPENGAISITNKASFIGETVSFSCDEGFVLNGTETRECTIRGWTGTQPTCDKAKITCEFEVTTSDLLSYSWPEATGGTTVSIMITRTCNEIGQWEEPNVGSYAALICRAESVSLPGQAALYSWPETMAGQTASITCLHNSGQLIYRHCTSNGEWDSFNDEVCRVLDKKLEMLINGFQTGLNKNMFENLTSEFSSSLKQSVNNVADQGQENLKTIALVFQSVADFVDSSEIEIEPTVVKNLVQSMDYLLQWNDSVLVDDSTSNIVESFEVVALLFAQQVDVKTITNATDIVFIAERISLKELQQSGRVFSISDLSDAHVNEVAAISIPASLFQRIKNGSQTPNGSVGVFFGVYNLPFLFPPSPDNNENENSTVGSRILAATVVAPGIDFNNLEEPVSITLGLTLNASLREPGTERCVSWDFALDDWTDEGCETDTENDDGVVTCNCTHLTNFAILVDLCRRTDGCEINVKFDKALSYITRIGGSISMASLLITIVTMLLFKKIRRLHASKYHVQLSIAIFCMLLVFMVGIERTENYGGCVTVSVLIHYFTLVAVMWMGAEALLLFQKLVVVFVHITTKYIVCVSLVCWFVPLLPVAIPLIADIATGEDPNNDFVVKRDQFCFLYHKGALYGAFIIPILLVITFNSFIFGIVIFILVRHTRGRLNRQQEQMKPSTAIRLMVSIIGVMFLFGLSWLFAALSVTNPGVRYTFQILFALLCSFQGFFIFLFFCVLSKEARESWKELLSCGKYTSKLLHPSYVLNQNKQSSSSVTPMRRKTGGSGETGSVASDNLVGKVQSSTSVKSNSESKQAMKYDSLTFSAKNEDTALPSSSTKSTMEESEPKQCHVKVTEASLNENIVYGANVQSRDTALSPNTTSWSKIDQELHQVKIAETNLDDSVHQDTTFTTNGSTVKEPEHCQVETAESNPNNKTEIRDITPPPSTTSLSTVLPTNIVSMVKESVSKLEQLVKIAKTSVNENDAIIQNKDTKLPSTATSGYTPESNPANQDTPLPFNGSTMGATKSRQMKYASTDPSTHLDMEPPQYVTNAPTTIGQNESSQATVTVGKTSPKGMIVFGISLNSEATALPPIASISTTESDQHSQATVTSTRTSRKRKIILGTSVNSQDTALPQYATKLHVPTLQESDKPSNTTVTITERNVLQDTATPPNATDVHTLSTKEYDEPDQATTNYKGKIALSTTVSNHDTELPSHATNASTTRKSNDVHIQAPNNHQGKIVLGTSVNSKDTALPQHATSLHTVPQGESSEPTQTTTAVNVTAKHKGKIVLGTSINNQDTTLPPIAANVHTAIESDQPNQATAAKSNSKGRIVLGTSFNNDNTTLSQDAANVPSTMKHSNEPNHTADNTRGKIVFGTSAKSQNTALPPNATSAESLKTGAKKMTVDLTRKTVLSPQSQNKNAKNLKPLQVEVQHYSMMRSNIKLL